MAKRKRSGKPPQARHGKKSQPSQHDKRGRLSRPNPERRRTLAPGVPLIGLVAALTGSMQQLLDARHAFRLPIVIAGAMLAKSRRTASSWFRAAGVGDDWDRFYECLISIGKRSASLMIPLLGFIMRRFDPGPEGSWEMAADDSPTQRFGRHVEGANVHHNPTPGPADGPWLYGHNWVSLAMLVPHPLWGVIAFPVLSLLYVRRCDVAALNSKYGWKFRTKHELALELVTRVVGLLRALGSQAKFVLIVDGAYAARALVGPLQQMKVTVISRLRRDARLFDLPPQRTGQRGRPRKYGKSRISLAKRAGHRDGWESITYHSRGVEVTRRYKSFLATSQWIGGTIRVVLLEHARGNWAAYFSTDTEMEVADILRRVAARWAIEEHFHDVKEVWGAGQQQVRNVWSNIGCWHLNSWLYTMVELACWDQDAATLVDRSDRPWDNPHRRPSHADRRRSILGKMLTEHFSTQLPSGPEHDKFRAAVAHLLNLAA